MKMALCFHLAPSQEQEEVGEEQLSLARTRLDWLASIEALIWRALDAQGGRSQARLWLCLSLANLCPPPRLQPRLFKDFMFCPSVREPPSQHGLLRQTFFCSGQQPLAARQLLRMLCEKRSARVAEFLGSDRELIRSFFSGHPKRIRQWFENFSSTGKGEHRLGAQALAHFAFVHRDTCWNELEWKGTHGQAPATVASKPHYFLELDVLRTVENFLDNVPAFWSSQELRECFKNGELLALDTDFFVEALHERLFCDESCEVWQMVKSFLEDEPFSTLCQRLLPLVNDRELLTFINDLARVFSSTGNVIESQKTNSCVSNLHWLEKIYLAGEACSSLDDAILCNACAGYGRQVLNIIREEENEEEDNTMKLLVSKLKEKGTLESKSHWALRNHLLTLNKWEAIKWLTLESWIAYFLLVQDYSSDGSLAVLLARNGIEYCHTDLISDERERKYRHQKTLKKRKEREKRRKKKRRKLVHSETEENSSSGVDDYCLVRSGEVREGYREAWHFSIDNFAIGWNKADIPEHLANYALGEWLKWATVNW